MALFGSNIMFNKKQIMSKKMFNNQAMSAIMQGKAGKFLDTKNKQKKFFDYMMQSAGKQGLTKEGMKEALWRMKKDGIMGSKIEAFAKEVMPGLGVNRFKEVKETMPTAKSAMVEAKPKSTLFFQNKANNGAIADASAPNAQSHPNDAKANMMSTSTQKLVETIDGSKTSNAARSTYAKPNFRTFNVGNLPKEDYRIKKSPEQEEIEKKVQYWNLLNRSVRKTDDYDKMDKAA